jgi:hypothetical protein
MRIASLERWQRQCGLLRRRAHKSAPVRREYVDPGRRGQLRCELTGQIPACTGAGRYQRNQYGVWPSSSPVFLSMQLKLCEPGRNVNIVLIGLRRRPLPRRTSATAVAIGPDAPGS